MADGGGGGEGGHCKDLWGSIWSVPLSWWTFRGGGGGGTAAAGSGADFDRYS